MERHRVKENIMIPSNVWGLYIKGLIDDVSAMVPKSNIEYFEFLLEKCDTLYKSIVHLGIELYENNKHLDRKDYFPAIAIADEKYKLSRTIATQLYNGVDIHQIMEQVKDSMLQRKNITRLGITQWSYDEFDET